MKKVQLTKGQRIIRDLAREIHKKCTRLHNKASLVANHPAEGGRNLTALRNTAAEILPFLDAIIDRRCRVCGCTQNDCEQGVEKLGDACVRVEADLCSACVEG